MADSLETIKETEESAAAARPETGLWAAVWQSVRGSHVHYDYTSGPLGRAIMLLAIPMVLEMLMESVFALVDMFFVAHLGADALAAVAVTEAMLTIIYTLAIGLGIGATAMIARRIGEGDPEGAARGASQTIALGVIVAVVLGTVGVIFAPRLLALMGARPEVVERGTSFTRVMLGGNLSVVMLFILNAIFRGAGDAAVAMRVLWLANGINILLCPCFIFGFGPIPALGVTGAAVATTIGRGVGALYAFSLLVRPGRRVRLTRRHLRLEPPVMLRLVRLSGTATFQVFVGMASWISLVRIISGFGSEALAGYVVAMRIILFALLPSWGLGNAAATLVGQSLGAGKPERAERAVWRAGFYNMIFLGAVGLVFVIFANPIVRLFAQEAAGPEVQRYAADGLRVVASGFLFYAWGMVVTQSFNGAGDTWTPTLINLFVFWLWEIPLAFLLAYTFGFGPHGVFLAVTIAFSTLAVVSAVLFRRGRWKTKAV